MARNLHAPRALAAALMLVALAACRHVPTTPSGLLRIDAVSPALVQSDAAQIVTVSGRGFVFSPTTFELLVTSPDGTSTVINGPDIHVLQTTAFQVSLVVAAAGVYRFVVQNSADDVSDPFSVPVAPAGSGGAASLMSVSPTVVTRGNQSQPITLTGTGFVNGATLRVTDPDNLTTDRTDITVVSATSITAGLLFSKVGIYTLRYVSPTGQVSNALTITANSI